MPKLCCREVRFYSQADEVGFFRALESIKGIREIEGRGEDLVLTVPARLSQESLRDLLGVFRRYGVDLRQLAVFRTVKNEGWFCDRGVWWFEAVFGEKSE
jgi:hypothetical protein